MHSSSTEVSDWVRLRLEEIGLSVSFNRNGNIQTYLLSFPTRVVIRPEIASNP